MAVNYDELDAVLKSMGVSRDSRPLQIEPGSKRAKVQIELKGGVQISAADFGDIPDVAGMFSHNGEHAFLYIDEPRIPTKPCRKILLSMLSAFIL